jgi:hypothetical protein
MVSGKSVEVIGAEDEIAENGHGGEEGKDG